MVNITASLTALLAAASFAAAAPASLEPQSDVSTHIFEKRAVSCRDDNYDVWKRGNVSRRITTSARSMFLLTQAQTADAARCITELAALGGQACQGSVSGTVFKKCGSTIIHGQNVCAPSEGNLATATWYVTCSLSSIYHARDY